MADSSAKTPCDPKELALKSFFLGPQAENAPWVSDLLSRVFSRWNSWRRSLFPQDGSAITDFDQRSTEFQDRKKSFEFVTMELLTRLEGEVPKFSPRYAGHMFSEVSLPALVGHIATLLHNPNNISAEASRVGTQIEEEAIQFLAAMVGYAPQNTTGHFTSGGTLANLEALVRAQSRAALWLSVDATLRAAGKIDAFDPLISCHQGWGAFDEKLRQLDQAAIATTELKNWRADFVHPLEFNERLESLKPAQSLRGPVILVPQNKHYSWAKGCRLLGLGANALWPIALDSRGRLSMQHLRLLIDRAMSEGRPILTVISVAGTTELGGVDPVDQVQQLLDEWREKRGIHLWHHVDGAYGGFFKTVGMAASQHFPADIKQAFASMPSADSITLDPHKLGYVPYASGAFLTREKRDYYFKTFEDAPYLDFDQTHDRGPYTLEGSRSAAGAVATWMTAKTIGLNPEGYGRILERTVRITQELKARLKKEIPSLQITPGCETNIICFSCAKDEETLSASNRRSLQIFEAFSPKKNGSFIVSKTTLPWKSYGALLDSWTPEWSAVRDTDEVVLVRMTLMNPFFSSVEMNVNYADLLIQELRHALESAPG